MTMEKILSEFWWKIRWSSRATAGLHVLAMFAPFNSWRIFFHRLRGTKIGRGVQIVQGCFLEESRPWLLEIEDNVTIGAGAIIATHDGVYNKACGGAFPYRYGKVLLKRNCVICPGSIIMPGVTVGERAVVAPGAVVKRDVPDGIMVAGSPARQLMTLEEGLAKCRENIPEYMAIDQATKYPWRLR